MERLTTFDGPEKNVFSRPMISPTIASDIEKTCQNIVRHTQDVSSGNSQIYQMNLYFKLDYENHLWLLLCTGLKIRKKKNHIMEGEEDNKEQKNSEGAINNFTLHAVEYPDVEDMESILKTIKINNGLMISKNPENQKFCANCLIEDVLYPIKMREVLKWRRSNPQDKIFLKLMKRIWGWKEEDKKVRKVIYDKNWLNVETRFCDNCYLEATRE